MWKPTIGSDELMHYAKGSHAKKHKYIAIKNGRYIYPEDKTDAYKKAQKKSTQFQPGLKKTGKYEWAEQEIFNPKDGSTQSGSKGDTYTYTMRSKSPDMETYEYPSRKANVQLHYNSSGGNKSHILSDIESIDYGAAAASKSDSTGKRYLAARRYADDAQDAATRKLLYENNKSGAKEMLKEKDKWNAVAESALTRYVQKKKYNKDQEKKAAIKNTSQAAGKKRTEHEIKKKLNDLKNASQSAGHKRTNYEKAKADNKYLTRSQNYGDRLEGARRIANAKGEYETARKLDKKVSLADRVYVKGANTEYDRAHNGYKRKGKKVTNQTARKNQRRAKIESAAFKAKRISKKAASKGKALFSKYFKSKTKTYVTDTFTGTRKPAIHSGKTINIKKR